MAKKFKEKKFYRDKKKEKFLKPKKAIEFIKKELLKNSEFGDYPFSVYRKYCRTLKEKFKELKPEQVKKRLYKRRFAYHKPAYRSFWYYFYVLDKLGLIEKTPVDIRVLIERGIYKRSRKSPKAYLPQFYHIVLARERELTWDNPQEAYEKLRKKES